MISILQQDAIIFLNNQKENSVDLIITDPPYSEMNKHLQLGKGRIVGEYRSKKDWFKEFSNDKDSYQEFLAASKRSLTPDGHIYIMFDSFSLLTLGGLVKNYFDVKNIIVWDKINIGMGHYFRRQHEFVLFATNKNKRKLRNQGFPDVWRFKRIHRASYPTQKPVELFQTMVFASTEPGFTVCDPFVGSGSSAIAAIKNNCNFIGADISKTAIDLTNRRISAYLENGYDILQNKPAFLPNQKIFWEQ